MGAPKSRMIAGATGDNLVFYDEASEASWIDAIGRDVRKWEMRYGSDFTTACEYTATVIGADTIAQGIVAGRRALITTAAAANSGLNLQVVGTPFQLAANKPLYFGAKLDFNTADGNDFFVGLASTDTAIIAAHAIDIAASAAGWYALSSTALVAYNEIHANSVTTTASEVLDTSAHVFEFLYNGSGTLSFYLDRVLMATHTTYVPTVVLTPSIVLQSSATGAAETCAIDWMRCIQIV